MELIPSTREQAYRAISPPRKMHILWINEAADFVGGCERYIHNTASLLNDCGVRSSLLHVHGSAECSADFIEPFDQAITITNIAAQINEIAPDLIYVHRLVGRNTIADIGRADATSVRFFHDTAAFCPREHRYTTLTHKTCNKPMGMRCYFPCLGVVNRSDSALKIRFNPVRSLVRELEANQSLDAYVVASDYMAQLLSDDGFRRDRIKLIPLYSNPPTPDTTVSRDEDLFLFVGHLIRSKGLDTLIHAMAQVEKPCRLAIAGRGRQEGMFRELTRSLELEDRISFLGQLEREELSKWYRKATCVVLPVRQPESFALVGPEAMSHGTPVIATSVGGIATWLEPGVTGLTVPSNSPAALAEAMERVLGDSTLRDSLGRNGLRHYEESFLPEFHVRSLLREFEKLVGARVA